MKMKKLLGLACAAWMVGVSHGGIDSALAGGAKFLLAKQAEDGHWSDPQMPALTALPSGR